MIRNPSHRSGWRFRSSRTLRWIVAVLVVPALAAAGPASAETLAQCYAQAQKTATRSLKGNEDRCHRGLILNHENLDSTGRKIEYQKATIQVAGSQAPVVKS